MSELLDPRAVDIDTLMRAEIRGLRKRLIECEAALSSAAFGNDNDAACDYSTKYDLDDLNWTSDGEVISNFVTSVLDG